jgi:pimeloyl-ACP methyl ester carboxylesterase
MSDPIPPWPGDLVQIPGGQVFVRAAPALPGAEPALFVHGLGGSSTNWTDLMEELRQPPADWASHAGPPAPALGCAAIDLPGFGFSPVPAARDYSINARAAAVAELIEENRNWPVHLIANSLGGAVCTRIAARRPDLVRTLTLISPALPDLRPRLLPLRLTVACAPGVGPWLLSRARGVPPERRSEIALRDCYADPSLMPAQRLTAEAAELARRDTLGYADEVLIGSARALVAEYTTRRGPRSLWHDAALVTAPTLVIHGSHDRLVNPAMAARAARAFRRARVVLLPRTGHVAMMERPALVAQEIRGLLAGAGRLTSVPG